MIQIYKSQPEVVTNLDLLEDVRSHKAKYFKRSTAKWEFAVPGSLLIIPPDDIRKSLLDDWEKMDDMFPDGHLPFTFNEMMLVLKEIDCLINNVLN